MSRRAQQSTGGLLDRIPIGRAAGLGAAAYVAVYAVTYLFVELQEDTDFGSTDVSQMDVAGWFFYSAHFVDIKLTQNDQTSTENIISEAADLTVPEPIWYIVPVVILVAIGLVAAMGLDERSASAQDAALSGAAVVAGYLPLAVVGTFLFKYETEQSFLGQTISTSITPDTAMAVGLAGVAYPVVLGAVGGFLSTLVADTGTSRPGGGRQRGGRGRQGGHQQGGRQGGHQQGGRQGGQQQRGRQQGGHQQGGRQGGQQNRGRQQGSQQNRGRQQGSQQRGGQGSQQRGGRGSQQERGQSDDDRLSRK